MFPERKIDDRICRLFIAILLTIRGKEQLIGQRFPFYDRQNFQRGENNLRNPIPFLYHAPDPRIIGSRVLSPQKCGSLREIFNTRWDPQLERHESKKKKQVVRSGGDERQYRSLLLGEQVIPSGHITSRWRGIVWMIKFWFLGSEVKTLKRVHSSLLI